MQNLFAEPVQKLMSSLSEEAKERASEAVLENLSVHIPDSDRDEIIDAVVLAISSVFSDFRRDFIKALVEVDQAAANEAPKALN